MDLWPKLICWLLQRETGLNSSGEPRRTILIISIRKEAVVVTEAFYVENYSQDVCHMLVILPHANLMFGICARVLH